jgi:ubiquinone biosynthesis protein
MGSPVSRPPSEGAVARAEPATVAPRGVRIALRAIGAPQVARLSACGALLAADALAARFADPFRSETARTAARTARRNRSARRIVATLDALKGVFVKAGQFAAMRHDLLPGEALGALSSLRDRVRPLPFAQIRRVVEADLGAPLEKHFACFDPEPLGAASLAQVHRAQLPTGEMVVVKVQYPWLESSLATDLTLIRSLLRAVSRSRDDADWERAFAEFASGVASELDFQDEARIAQEIANNLARDPRIVVPAPIFSHTTRRVLTMSYHPVLPLSDPARLAAAGVDMRTVLEIIVRAYAKQVLADGLFHADPHPGNLFVIDEPEAVSSPRVLFIDFGLSRRLAPALRQEMRQGLYALLQRDVDAFVEGMDRMGMLAAGSHDGVRRSVRAMFERITETAAMTAGSSARILGLKDEAKVLLQQTEGVQLPMDLLFYAKTVSYIFALGAQLAPDVDVMKLSLPYLLEFLAQQD